ncbi:MAG: SRPBCC family protein [Pseudomonadota bacterium]
MKFSAVEDIAAPLSHVWDKVSDFDYFEGRIAGRAGRVERVPLGPVGQGTSWAGRASLNGKMRDVKMRLATFSEGDAMSLLGGTDGMQVSVDVQLLALGPKNTRLTVVTEAKARTLAARLMLQSARLARGTLAKRYKTRVAGFAEAIEKSATG